MKDARRDSLLRFLAFIVLTAMLLFLCNTYLVKTDAAAALMLDEMKQHSGIDVAFVGSSVVRHAINPEVIAEKAGMNAFDVSLSEAGTATTLAALRLLLEVQAPACAVFVIDVDMLMRTRESIVTQAMLMPAIRNPVERVRYYLDLCSADARYLERLAFFRQFPVSSPDELKKTLDIHRNPDVYREQINSGNDRYRYMGSGYLRVFTTMRKGAHYERGTWMPQRASGGKLRTYTARHILSFRELCERKHVIPVVMLSPMPDVFRIAFRNNQEVYSQVEEFCAENGILCLNTARVRPEKMPSLEEHFYDMIHLDGEGSDVLSAYLAGVLPRIMDGEDVSGDFYGSWEELADAYDEVVNVYLNLAEISGDTLTLEADSNRGSAVTPVYRFCARDGEGTEVLLRDYEEDGAFSCPAALVTGKTLVVYCRAEDEQSQPVRYLVDL